MSSRPDSAHRGPERLQPRQRVPFAVIGPALVPLRQTGQDDEVTSMDSEHDDFYVEDESLEDAWRNFEDGDPAVSVSPSGRGHNEELTVPLP